MKISEKDLNFFSANGWKKSRQMNIAWNEDFYRNR